MTLAVVETGYGKVKGVQEGDITVWKGIRYAKPPIGELRFRSPQPPEPWDDVYDASQFGPAAYQMRSPLFETDSVQLSEDCLSLNIWTPGADDKRRPVMVYIHGGTFVTGSGRQRLFDGGSFAKAGDVVLVTINYRLGALGFLYLGEIAGSQYASSGNCGLLDQVAALKWVRENISGFGGDPDRVTVFGESAGSISVSSLLCMPEAKGLFQQAILQSGLALGHRWAMSDTASASEKAREVCSLLEIDDIHMLMELPAEDLIRGTQSILWKPMVDGVTIPYSLLEALEGGYLNNIPMIVGTNLNEEALFFLIDPEWPTLDDESRKLRCNVRGPFPPEVEPFYLNGKTGGSFHDGLTKMATYGNFVGPVQQFVERQVHRASLWVYRFDWGRGPWKAVHVAELPFIFNTTDYPFVPLEGKSDEIEAMVNQMHSTWITFANKGNPNNDTIPHWPQYNLQSRPTMIFDSPSHMENDPYHKERSVWEQVGG